MGVPLLNFFGDAKYKWNWKVNGMCGSHSSHNMCVVCIMKLSPGFCCGTHRMMR
jgi:hypothetical protein